MVRAKSGTSFDRAMKRSKNITLIENGQLGLLGASSLNVVLYHMRLSIIQHKPSIHPVVISPRIVFQLSKRSAFTVLPATSAVNNIRAAATA